MILAMRNQTEVSTWLFRRRALARRVLGADLTVLGGAVILMVGL